VIQGCGVLRDGHVQIASDATFVAVDGKIERPLGCDRRFILDLGFVLQDSHGRQIIFHLLESSEHALSICGGLEVISRRPLIGERAAFLLRTP
jgi:hypothetical protein